MSKTPPFLVRLPEKSKRILILSVGSLLFIVLFAIVLNSLGKIGKNPSGETAAKTAESGVDWAKARGRTDMTELKYTAMMVMEDIETFKTEATNFHEDLKKLLISKQGESMKPTENVIDYFRIRWKERLPNILFADMYRDKVKDYLRIANNVLREENGGNVVPQDIYDEIRLIGVKSWNCTTLYRRHNELLDALKRKIGEGPKIDPKSIQAEVVKAEDEFALESLKVLPVKELENVNPSPSYFTGVSSKPDAALDYLDGFYRRQNQNLLEKERSREGKETLMRDALPDRSAE